MEAFRHWSSIKGTRYSRGGLKGGPKLFTHTKLSHHNTQTSCFYPSIKNDGDCMNKKKNTTKTKWTNTSNICCQGCQLSAGEV